MPTLVEINPTAEELAYLDTLGDVVAKVGTSPAIQRPLTDDEKAQRVLDQRAAILDDEAIMVKDAARQATITRLRGAADSATISVKDLRDLGLI